MSIELLNPGNREDVDAVATLYENYLGDSPIAGLGPIFLRRFFYKTLIKDGLVYVFTGRRDGRIVSFLSLTPRPLDFVMTGVRAHFFYLSWLMLLTILQKPSRITGILSALRMIGARKSEAREERAEGLGEVISIVTHTDSRNYTPPGAKRTLTSLLFEEMTAWFRARNFERVHLLVKPENRASNMFCSIMGCKFEKIVIGGVTTHRYTYYFDPQKAAAARGAAE
jgi:hypothetical protein